MGGSLSLSQPLSLSVSLTARSAGPIPIPSGSRAGMLIRLADIGRGENFTLTPMRFASSGDFSS